MGRVCPAPWEPEGRGALGEIPAQEERCVQASWLPAMQVAWWALPALSLCPPLCLYLVSLLAVRLSGQTLDPPLGLPRVCCRGSGYWT